MLKIGALGSGGGGEALVIKNEEYIYYAQMNGQTRSPFAVFHMQFKWIFTGLGQ